jgi:hypothetical protein
MPSALASSSVRLLPSQLPADGLLPPPPPALPLPLPNSLPLLLLLLRCNTCKAGLRRRKLPTCRPMAAYLNDAALAAAGAGTHNLRHFHPEPTASLRSGDGSSTRSRCDLYQSLATINVQRDHLPFNQTAAHVLLSCAPLPSELTTWPHHRLTANRRLCPVRPVVYSQPRARPSPVSRAMPLHSSSIRDQRLVCRFLSDPASS